MFTTPPGPQLTVPPLRLDLYFRWDRDLYNANPKHKKYAARPGLIKKLFGRNSDPKKVREDLHALHRQYEDRHSAPLLMTDYINGLNLDDVHGCLKIVGSAYEAHPTYENYQAYIRTALLLTHRGDLIQKWVNPEIVLSFTSALAHETDTVSKALIIQHMPAVVQDTFVNLYLDNKARSLNKALHFNKNPKIDTDKAWFSISMHLRDLEYIQRSVHSMPLLAKMMHPDYIFLMKEALKMTNPVLNDSGSNTALDAYAELTVLTAGFPDLHTIFEADEVLQMGRKMLTHERLSAFAKLKSAFREDSFKSSLLESVESQQNLYLEHISNRSAMHHHGGRSACQLDASIAFKKTKTGTKVSISTFQDSENFGPASTQYKAWDTELKQASFRSIGAEYEVEMMRATLRMLAGIADGYDYAIVPDGPLKEGPAFVKDAALRELKKIEPIRYQPRYPKAAQAMRTHFADTRGGINKYQSERPYESWAPPLKLTA